MLCLFVHNYSRLEPSVPARVMTPAMLLYCWLWGENLIDWTYSSNVPIQIVLVGPSIWKVGRTSKGQAMHDPCTPSDNIIDLYVSTCQAKTVVAIGIVNWGVHGGQTYMDPYHISFFLLNRLSPIAYIIDYKPLYLAIMNSCMVWTSCKIVPNYGRNYNCCNVVQIIIVISTPYVAVDTYIHRET